jgi:hypothetical protein
VGRLNPFCRHPLEDRWFVRWLMMEKNRVYGHIERCAKCGAEIIIGRQRKP